MRQRGNMSNPTEDKKKEQYINNYIKSLANIEDSMEPFKEHRRDLRKEYADNSWLSKDEQRLAVRAWRMIQKEESITDFNDLHEKIRKALGKV